MNLMKLWVRLQNNSNPALFFLPPARKPEIPYTVSRQTLIYNSIREERAWTPTWAISRTPASLSFYNCQVIYSV